MPDAIKPGGRGFEVIDELSVLPARGMAAADFNEDGHTDIYVSNYRLQGNRLWINNGSEFNFPFTFGSDSHGARGGDGHSIGNAFGDLASDGHIESLRVIFHMKVNHRLESCSIRVLQGIIISLTWDKGALIGKSRGLHPLWATMTTTGCLMFSSQR